MASCNSEAIKSQFFVKLEFRVMNGLKTPQTKVISFPIEILQPLSSYKPLVKGSRIEYPVPINPPSEFRPRMMPGAHYKVSVSDDMESSKFEMNRAQKSLPSLMMF